jgi:hypothetical protein
VTITAHLVSITGGNVSEITWSVTDGTAGLINDLTGVSGAAATITASGSGTGDVTVTASYTANGIEYTASCVITVEAVTP